MPTVDDAIRLLTDPANRAFGRSQSGMVEMRPPAILGELQAMGADEDTARALADQALTALGGHWDIQHQRRGLPPRIHSFTHIWVPESALRG